MQKRRLSRILHRALSLAERELDERSCSVVLAAAGRSERFGAKKPFVQVGGRCLFEYSLSVFLASRYVRDVVIAARQEDIPQFREVLSLRFPGAPVTVVAGGSSRDISVMRAFEATDKKTHFVAFHDAARPMLSTEDAERVLRDAFRYGAASAACPIVDSVKRACDGVITEDVDREGLYAVSTPQIFHKDVYLVSRAICKKDGFSSTDDNAYVSHAGFSVHLTPVFSNPKLTYPEDLRLIETLLNARGEPCK